MTELGLTTARRLLEEINRHLLGGKGEIHELPGKLNLVWTNPVRDTPRYLAVKSAGEGVVLINGRRWPNTEAGLKQGLRACLSDEDMLARRSK